MERVESVIITTCQREAFMIPLLAVLGEEIEQHFVVTTCGDYTSDLHSS
jgi:hypothetical protein